MPNELTHLTLTELSLVDNPANPLAMAPIFKANTPNGENMTDNVEKMNPEMDSKVKAYMKAKGCDRKTAMDAVMKAFDTHEALTKENEMLRKSLIENGFAIKADSVEKKMEPEYIEYDGEKINKADVPMVILKRLETVEFEKREAEIKKSASEKFPNLKADLAVELIKADFEDEFLTALMALDALFGEQMEEVGKTNTSDGDMADPSEKLNALAKKYAEENNMTFAKGYTEVVKTDVGKALVKETYKKD